MENIALYPGHSLKRPGNLPEFKLLTSAALESAIPIKFQNASRDSCRIQLHHKCITVQHNTHPVVTLALERRFCSEPFW